jgi:hypothetical protein
MTEEQAGNVKFVYRALLQNDYARDWTETDNHLHFLEYLTDEQTILEAEVQVYKHGQGVLKCNEDHGENLCLVSKLMDAVNSILELYVETKELHPKNRYVLHNYIAASHMKLIYVEIVEE